MITKIKRRKLREGKEEKSMWKHWNDSISNELLNYVSTWLNFPVYALV